ncbi:WXG100 family type VII secretion target [Mycolicibacterium sp. BK556]|uniref:WXG100 family type VII secretion target n=1 Tax=Mycobacteriaceae TaxID=1762 RepID=UPI00105F5822|nr:WXG100 family type VII secretion target [Mycobacterium sp. BK086]MBB3602523.1 WXG100 family type VII secretion target [Mycolicibacterium sp. BK556]MBB3632275.1 WXG100 family type VII secretion target [Mycolicibacterium sp. BK607]MBB3750296.1 WXG100 family type VII secretion target [Mycolicibacterium sp. BK634]
MTGDGGVLRVDPDVMRAACEALTAGAQHLQAGLRDLDAEAQQVLGTWDGSAGSSYGAAWKQWHDGSLKVQQALATIAERLGQVGQVFESHEQGSAAQLRGLTNG